MRDSVGPREIGTTRGDTRESVPPTGGSRTGAAGGMEDRVAVGTGDACLRGHRRCPQVRGPDELPFLWGSRGPGLERANGLGRDGLLVSGEVTTQVLQLETLRGITVVGYHEGRLLLRQEVECLPIPGHLIPRNEAEAAAERREV